MPRETKEFRRRSIGSLRRFVPALRHAERVLEEEAERLRRRVEARELEVLNRNRSELQELRGLIARGETITPSEE